MTAIFESDPIIVYGAPRSGTTYLEQVLNAHPEVFISHETRVFAWLRHALALTDDHRVVANDREPFVEHLRMVFPDLMRDFYRKLAPNSRYWGDKNPHYADPFNEGTLELVAELFPESRFIHIIRDGRDVVSSLMRKRWGEDDKPWVTFDQAHFTWKKHVDIGQTFGRALPSHRYFELHYEDLVADDLAVAARLFDFLEIELNPAVETFCRGQREARTPFKDPTRDFGRGIDASDWATLFSADEQFRSLKLIGDDLVRNGYETEESLAQLRECAATARASQAPAATPSAAPAEG